MKATFENSVSILVKAYFNGSLKKACPCGCAVGNLIMANMRYTIDQFIDDYSPNGSWFDIVVRQRMVVIDHPHIMSTGYTVEQLRKIENSFESAGNSCEENIEFKCLMAVVDVLAEIHNIDLKSKEEAKSLFQGKVLTS